MFRLPCTGFKGLPIPSVCVCVCCCGYLLAADLKARLFTTVRCAVHVCRQSAHRVLVGSPFIRLNSHLHPVALGAIGSCMQAPKAAF